MIISIFGCLLHPYLSNKRLSGSLALQAFFLVTSEQGHHSPYAEQTRREHDIQAAAVWPVPTHRHSHSSVGFTHRQRPSCCCSGHWVYNYRVKISTTREKLVMLIASVYLFLFFFTWLREEGVRRLGSGEDRVGRV